MASTAVIRVDARRKARAEKIIRRLGLTTEQAVNVFLARIEQTKGIPFAVTLEDSPPSKAESIAFWDKLYQDAYTR